MGAKAPASKRFRRHGLKCEFCGRFVTNLASLQSHQKAIHASSLKKRNTGRVTRSGLAKKPQKVVVKRQIKLLPIKKQLKVSEPKINTRKMPREEDESTMVLDHSKISLTPSTSRKIEFKCPKCEKLYPVYFSALRHLQKNHFSKCENDEKVEPIRIELCIHCNADVTNTDMHMCSSSNIQDLGFELSSYVCTGCDQTFSSMKLFDVHVSGLHSEGVESMFFPTLAEFTTWKEDMTTQTKCPYLIMGKYSSKHIYRCANTMNDRDNATAHFCPSTIIYQEFTKGIQVHFYKQHSGHYYDEYSLTEKYKKYSITGLLQQATHYTDMVEVKSDEKDLYVQFKTLMESIVLDAAKIKVDTLNILIGKALDMTSILTNYDEDSDNGTITNRPVLSVTKKKDINITKALENIKQSQSPKRSINDASDVPAKRLRSKSFVNVEQKSPILQKSLNRPLRNTNTFSLSDDKDSKKILKELDEITIRKTKLVTRNTQDKDEIENVKSNKRTESPAAKNKMNETKVRKEMASESKADKTPRTPILGPVKPITPLDQSPSSFNDSYKDFVDKTFIKSKEKLPVSSKTSAKKKVVVKTKMGQFKPSTPPKSAENERKTTNGKIVKKDSVGKVKDVRYEVMEREDDCNILILKM